MSNIIKAMATARESSYFKQEQEADLQRHRTQLVSMGKIENAAGANLRPRRQKTFEESLRAFEVLPEVLQQHARIDDPSAARRREIIRRIRGMPQRLSEAELARYRSTIYGVAAHVGHVPKMSFGRNKWHAAAAFSDVPSAAAPLSPEAVETAQRAYSAGVRSLMYGSMLGFLGVAVLGTIAFKYMGVNSLQDLAPSPDQQGGLIARWLQPYKERIQAYRAPPVAAGAMQASGSDNLPLTAQRQSDAANSEFAQRLASRYNPRHTKPGTTADQRAADVF